MTKSEAYDQIVAFLRERENYLDAMSESPDGDEWQALQEFINDVNDRVEE